MWTLNFLFQKERVKTAEIVKLPIAAGLQPISVTDDVKEFFDAFRNYLVETKPLSETTIEKHLRLFREAVLGPRGMEEERAELGFGGSTVCDLIRNSLKPGGYINRKQDTCSANTLRMMVDACRYALSFMGETANRRFCVAEEGVAMTLRPLQKARSKSHAFRVYTRKRFCRKMQAKNKIIRLLCSKAI